MADPESQSASKEASSSSPVTQSRLFPETDLARGIVGWDGQDDLANPQNFPTGRKWALLGLVSSITFVSPLASSMFSPAVGFMAAGFGVRDETVLSFSVSIFLLGYTVIFLALYPDVRYCMVWYGILRSLIVRSIVARPPERDIRPSHRPQRRQLVLRHMATRLRPSPQHRVLDCIPLPRWSRRRWQHHSRRGGHR